MHMGLIMRLFDRLPETIRRRFALSRAYREVFETDAGKQVLADLAKKSGLLATSFAPGDPQATHFAEGRRSLMLEIIAELRWSETEIMQLASARTNEALGNMETENA